MTYLGTWYTATKTKTHIYIYIHIRICNAYVYTIHDNCSLSLEGILNVHFFYNTTNNDELAETTSSRVKHRQGIGVDVPSSNLESIWFSFHFLRIPLLSRQHQNSGVLKPTHIYLIIKKKLIGNLFIFSLFSEFFGILQNMGFFHHLICSVDGPKIALSRSTTTFQTLLGRICPRWRKLPRSTLGPNETQPVGNQPGPNQPEAT